MPTWNPPDLKMDVSEPICDIRIINNKDVVVRYYDNNVVKEIEYNKEELQALIAKKLLIGE